MLSNQRRSSNRSPAPPRLSTKATCVSVVTSEVSGLSISNRGVMPMAYTGIASGSPCVDPYEDDISAPPSTNRRDGTL